MQNETNLTNTQDGDINSVLKVISPKDGLEQLLPDILNDENLSASKIQRHLQIGFHDAATIIDYLVQIGALSDYDTATRQRQYLNKQLVIDTLCKYKK